MPYNSIMKTNGTNNLLKFKPVFKHAIGLLGNCYV